jgi:hypothetical protein
MNKSLFAGVFLGAAALATTIIMMGSETEGGRAVLPEASTLATATGVAVDDTAAGIVVVGSTYVGDWPDWTAFIKNAGGGSGDSFSDVWAEGSPDGTLWISLSTAESALEQEANTLATGNGGIAMMGSNASIMYIRIKAKCAAGEDTTADGWITANRN